MPEIIKKEITRIRKGGLKSLCHKRGVSIAELARKTKISEAALHRFDKGKRSMPFEKWTEIMKYLDTLK